ncbi:tyrosine-type recombinase/integrase [Sulfitobacter sp. D35]|uniref:tyrosine-type recombinase/integrase n=1 Tax=Sulfitobacter sp. D35 TaxID=3083252 RepID=UPI00296F0883|nr:tyrosine-type recombinase/integrase [Sulfitobacter sp. D35]MDW4500570.1 tyrosine-type recombinase/integrase [Sulfitobacter sp. D35]
MSYLRRAERFLLTQQQINPCRFADADQISQLPFRPSPYWHTLYRCRHLGIHRPDDSMCNWTARILTKEKLYRQKCLGPALDTGHGTTSLRSALARAFEWFDSGAVRSMASEPKDLGRTRQVSICPIGDIYTVGHALRDYTEWTRIARSPGGHYNNLVLINHHLVPHLANLPLEKFCASHLRDLAQQVLETPPRYGFSEYKRKVGIETLTADELRRRKRTFNSLVTILKMAFRHAWDNAAIQSERPWRCLKRIPVNHTPRTIFLDRDECRRLLAHCTPALRDLVLAALYSGCRVGELGNLIVNDVGRQGFGLRIGAFKQSPARFVFLPDEGMAFFLSKCEGKSAQDHVLLSDMGKPWRRQHTQLFRRAVAKARLPRDLVFHGLRHTYASDLIRSGVQLEVVAKQLGHASTTTVSNTYGHLAEQFREDQIRRRFNPLDADQATEARRRKPELEKLWSSLQTDDWRHYAHVRQSPLTSGKSLATPVREVSQVFDAAAREISSVQM